MAASTASFQMSGGSNSTPSQTSMSGGWSYSWGGSAAPKPKPDLVGRNVSKMAPQSKKSLKQPKSPRNTLPRLYSTHFPYREKHCNKKNSTQSEEYPRPLWTWPISTIFPQRGTRTSINSRSRVTYDARKWTQQIQLHLCMPQTYACRRPSSPLCTQQTKRQFVVVIGGCDGGGNRFHEFSF